jgi:hypothetical protein
MRAEIERVKIRDSGIRVIGKLKWGEHFCLLYNKKQELTDTVVPYIKAGLENNELCAWIASDHLEAEKELRNGIPEFDTYLNKGQIEIIRYNDWYLKTGFFDLKGISKEWIHKFNMALEDDYSGLRIAEDIVSLEEYKDDFGVYEKEISHVVHNHKILTLCTYSLKGYNASEIIDVINDHHFALVKKGGKWEKIKRFEEDKKRL